jgi:hypothetical protein
MAVSRPSGRKAGFLLLAASLLAPVWGGCQKTLFMDDDAASMWKLRYYDGDSATATSESRRKVSDMGFGFPTGPSLQQ